jgi:hypothetical protein
MEPGTGDVDYETLCRLATAEFVSPASTLRTGASGGAPTWTRRLGRTGEMEGAGGAVGRDRGAEDAVSAWGVAGEAEQATIRA